MSSNNYYFILLDFLEIVEFPFSFFLLYFINVFWTWSVDLMHVQSWENIL